jgi:hypothetical protein
MYSLDEETGRDAGGDAAADVAPVSGVREEVQRDCEGDLLFERMPAEGEISAHEGDEAMTPLPSPTVLATPAAYAPRWLDVHGPSLSRRRFLGAGAAAGALLLPGSGIAAEHARSTRTTARVEPDGPPDPFPIPWLDKNGSHNQPAGPDLEPSHIYHFKGRVARSAGFSGVGTDETGERLLFGTRTTDYGIMDGEYWAARAPQRGAFTHI